MVAGLLPSLAMPRILRLVPTGDFSLILSVLPLHKDTLWMPQISPAVAPFLHRSVERCRLTWNVKHLCESPTENIGTVDAFIHGDILDGDKGTDVHRSGPRMLSCVTNTHTHIYRSRHSRVSGRRSPECLLMSIRVKACRAAFSAPSTTSCGDPTKV